MKIVIDAERYWDELYPGEYLASSNDELTFEIHDEHVTLYVGGYAYTIDKSEFSKLAKLVMDSP